MKHIILECGRIVTLDIQHMDHISMSAFVPDVPNSVM